MIPFLAVLSLCLFWLYFALRITFIIDAQNAFGQVFPMAWAFVSIEVICSIPTFTQTFWALFTVKKRNRPKLRLISNDTPYVDVFITCCGEDDDLVLDTVRAAADLDWPRDRFRVIVLDDGKSQGLERACEDLKDTYYNVFYRSRPKFPGVPHHFKAGNLNYGLEEVHNMPGGAFEFM
jgi:cellulose synthase/poly-beta-1,6-N-acetylglucosamine synthase-like glycosyltransferase